jgi:hypothetical protein
MKSILIALFIGAGTLMSQMKSSSVPDVHSFANNSEITIAHIALDLSPSILGQRPCPAPQLLSLDRKKKKTSHPCYTRDLSITGVSIDGSRTSPVKFTLGDEVKFLGRPLRIHHHSKNSHRDDPLFHITECSRSSMAGAVPNIRKGKTIPLHSVSSDPRTHVGAVYGRSGCAYDLFRDHPHTSRSARRDERG